MTELLQLPLSPTVPKPRNNQEQNLDSSHARFTTQKFKFDFILSAEHNSLSEVCKVKNSYDGQEI